MEIIRAKHMGFCFGVAGAIKMCYKVSSDEKNKGTILASVVYRACKFQSLTMV